MGTIIKASFASPDGPQSSVGMAVFAARNCLARARMAMEDVDLLINVGVFRDDNIIEPAMATLIQQQLGMNLDPTAEEPMRKTTLSFDINDGDCGLITAARVVDTLFKAGSSQSALIVSGDIHPSKSPRPDFPFQSVAAAVLLTRSEEDSQGFSRFHCATSGSGGHGFSAHVNLTENGRRGRECMDYLVEDGYRDRLSDFTAAMIGEWFPSGADKPDHIDFIVTSQPAKGFGAEIARFVDPKGRARVVDLYETYGDPHTSSLTLGYHDLAGKGLLKRGDRILFIAAGSGLSAACALYVV